MWRHRSQLKIRKHLSQQLQELKQIAVAKYCDKQELCVYVKPVGRDGEGGVGVCGGRVRMRP